jgi:3-methyladenine DNA glycosylase AlkD
MTVKQRYHEILTLIEMSTDPAAPKFADTYLGTTHPRYSISGPNLRMLAREWTRQHATMKSGEMVEILTWLIHGPSATEKLMAGMIMDHLRKAQRLFSPVVFDDWLIHVEGWAEVDAICTGKFMTHHLPLYWSEWKPLLKTFAKSKDVQKRRASLVCFCSPVRHVVNDDFALTALSNIKHLQNEKAILITKAISWLLRSMVKHHRKQVESFLKKNRDTLPSIAIRETEKVLLTGRKTSK